MRDMFYDHAPLVNGLVLLNLEHDVTHIHSVNAKRCKVDNDSCRCQNRRISGRGSRAVRLRWMVTGGRGHNVLPRFGPS